MNPHCSHNSRVREAVIAHQWTRALLDHVLSCDDCLDVAAVGMLRDAALDLNPRALLPAADSIWWRAELRRCRRAQRRAGQALDVIQYAIAVAGIVGSITAGAATSTHFLPWIGLPIAACVGIYWGIRWIRRKEAVYPS